ncbi:MAG: methionine--tRNA ligase [Candidatus Saccharibacteria bacterium]|nr:methionine--tRNA ligase [Candidatus Saccharibacteria bacterium]
MKNVYITTAIPYVNGNPHIGHVEDYLLADISARYAKLNGASVRFQVGTDEHGNKIEQKAKSLNRDVQEYVDENAENFKTFISKLGVEYTDFIRTTDADHMKRVQEIWKNLKDHIYLNKYEGWYCTGCERFITDKECEENGGVCPDHQANYDRLEESNYYLRIADFKDEIRAKIESDEMKILPESRKKQVLKLLEDTPDVSISRPKTHLTWGVPVPGDDSQVMYVWMDALSNYITVLGYPDAKDFDDFWPASVQIVGKDILRFHAIIWPSILLGLGLPLPKVLLSHGFILANGQKMSKSIGNVVDPIEVLERHGLDATRYYFSRHIDTFDDSDFTWEKFDNAYNNELANDFGNLVQRLAAMSKKNEVKGQEAFEPIYDGEYKNFMDNYEYTKAMDYVWSKVQDVNKHIEETKPWMVAKEDPATAKKLLEDLDRELLQVNYLLKPFLPDATSKVEDIFVTSDIIEPGTPLFPKN